MCIGRKENGKAIFTGTNSLKQSFEMYKSNINLANSIFIFLHDCDTKTTFENFNNKLFNLCIEPNNSNILIKKGIENLFSKEFFEVEYLDRQLYYKSKQEVGDYGQVSTIDSFDKVAFCNYIISRNNKQDFENFKSILTNLNGILN